MRVEQEGGYARLGESRPLGDLLEWRSIGVGLALGGCDNVARRAPTLGEPPAIGGIGRRRGLHKERHTDAKGRPRDNMELCHSNPPSLQIKNAPNPPLSL